MGGWAGVNHSQGASTRTNGMNRNGRKTARMQCRAPMGRALRGAGTA